MMQTAGMADAHTKDLEKHGLMHLAQVHWNLPTALLYEETGRRREGWIVQHGPVMVNTEEHTGRSPKDKFIVQEPSCVDQVWWGEINQPMAPEHFEGLKQRLFAYLQDKELFVQDCYASADPAYRIGLRVITEKAWHSLCAQALFIASPTHPTEAYVPEYTIIDAPGFCANPRVDGTNSETFIVLHLAQKLVLIGGTAYAGAIKKSVFTLRNYLLPQARVLSMHCSANTGTPHDVALFFGLSGTGKTTLTYALIHAALNGGLQYAPMLQDPIFGGQIPTACPGVPEALLQPRRTWSDTAAYDAKARQLARSSQEHCRPLAEGLDTAVHAAGPKVGQRRPRALGVEKEYA